MREWDGARCARRGGGGGRSGWFAVRAWDGAGARGAGAVAAGAGGAR